jgi:predicted aconitase
MSASLQLTAEERAMLAGEQGRAVKKSMEILTALGEIYGARRLIPVTSVQVAGVSYDNLGEAGLGFLDEMARDGRVRVLTTLNPAGMDVERWRELGIDEAFAARQQRVLDAFARMGVITTCTCTPYLVGNLPRFGQHLAWSESSAVCFANSVLGARTNREGGPSALAAALTGRTPEHGLHLDDARAPEVTVEVAATLADETDFGALGVALGEKVGGRVACLTGISEQAGLEELKMLCASAATYGGTALFHVDGVTPEAGATAGERVTITDAELEQARAGLSDDIDVEELDFVSIGCPHASLAELARIAEALDGKRVRRETWIHLARPLKSVADRAGYSRTIEASGARLACDTCMVVAPLKGRFRALATNSAKCVYYGRNKNGFRVLLRPLEQCLRLATGGAEAGAASGRGVVEGGGAGRGVPSRRRPEKNRE